MTAHSARHESLSTSSWQLAPVCYKSSYRVAAIRAGLVSILLLIVLALIILI